MSGSHAEASQQVSKSRGKRKVSGSTLSSSSFSKLQRGSHNKRGKGCSDLRSLSSTTDTTSEGRTLKKGHGTRTVNTSEGSSQIIEGKVSITDYDYFSEDDAEYAEELQLQEALHASACNGTLSVEPQVFCEICLENIESWQMFANDQCSHSFCCECTTNHIMAKVQDGEKKVTCPALNCKATLNPEACRLMIPEYAVVQWDTLQCLSLIPESSKLYCPFNDCSALLVNDSELVTAKAKCIACKRSFCTDCRVPWHKKLTCEEYQNTKKTERDDKKLEKLAKKKKWQQCPKCKVYVEKTAGCLHITCRCSYEFCYRCGAEWHINHDGNC